MEKTVKAEETPCCYIQNDRVYLSNRQEYVNVNVVDEKCPEDNYSAEQLIEVDIHYCDGIWLITQNEGRIRCLLEMIYNLIWCNIITSEALILRIGR